MSENLFGKDYAVDVAINRFKLEQECEAQPSLYYYYADMLAGLKADRDRVDDKLGMTMSNTELAVRTAPGKYLGEVKPTEATIKAAVDANLEVRSLREELTKTNEQIYHLEAVVRSLDHRKSELDNLVQLWIKGYYAAPDGGKPSSNDDYQKQVRKNLNKDKEESNEK